jgi:hypothetical protein
LLEEVRVGVESHARARVTEDAAHLDDVEPDIDDQVAGEGVTEIVEAQVAVAIETGVPGGAAEGAFGDVVVQERRAPFRCEHIVGAAAEARSSAVVAQDDAELGRRGMSRSEARVLGGTRCGGIPRRPRASW